MTDIRITREGLEAVTGLTTSPEVRLTRESVEVVTGLTTSPEVRLSRISIEVVASLALGGVATPIRRIINVSYM